MKLFDAALFKQWEQETIAKQYNNSAELMELAAENCYLLFPILFLPKPLIVICGTGNNGGDGLCIARMAAEQDQSVEVLIAGDPDKGSADFKLNLNRLLVTNVKVTFLNEHNYEFHLTALDGHIIDCLFGTGLNRPLEGWLADVVRMINQSTCQKVAIDVPSGLMADSMEPQSGEIVKAYTTLTFQMPKRAFFFKENHDFVGSFYIVNLKLNEDFEATHDSDIHYFDQNDAAGIFKSRLKYTYKSEQGHARIIAGSKGMMGAALLCAKACARAGVGIVTAHVPQIGYQIMQLGLPEAICHTDDGENYISSAEYDARYSATAIGPGIGTAPETVLMLRRILKSADKPLVLDADALNIIGQKNLLADIPKMSILTPHAGEFDRLFGPHANSFDRLKTLRKKSTELELIIVLKGPHSAIALPNGQLYFNASGGPVLATAGSGDVLTGIICSLLAQDYSPADAARLGVFAHGKCGDIFTNSNGSTGILAGDFAEKLRWVFTFLDNSISNRLSINGGGINDEHDL